MSDKPVLTPKEEAFAAGLAAGLTQAAAYRAAFPNSTRWKDETVWSRASELAKTSKVQGRYEHLLQNAADKNDITIERIIAEVAKVAFGDARDVMEWGPSGVRLKDSTTITDAAAAAVAEVTETTSMNGGSLKLKRHDKLGALKFLAEIKGYMVHKTEVTGKDGKDLVPETPKGVLVVPGVMAEGDWEKMMQKGGA